MQITDIKIRKLFDEGPMKAIVSVTFDIMYGELTVKGDRNDSTHRTLIKQLSYFDVSDFHDKLLSLPCG